MREKEIFRIIGFLGSRWARDDPKIKPYACNFFFDEMSDIDVILMFIRNPRLRRLFEIQRKILEIKGKALWIGNSDPITQLAIKTGVIKEVEY